MSSRVFHRQAISGISPLDWSSSWILGMRPQSGRHQRGRGRVCHWTQRVAALFASGEGSRTSQFWVYGGAFTYSAHPCRLCSECCSTEDWAGQREVFGQYRWISISFQLTGKCRYHQTRMSSCSSVLSACISCPCLQESCGHWPPCVPFSS